MSRTVVSEKLEKEFKEIFSLNPNDLGNKYLTVIYKYVTGPLKKMPFIYVIPTSFLFSILLYIILGHFVIKLVSLLQYAF